MSTEKQRPYYGNIVKDGVLRYLAPTTVQKADPNDNNGGGCTRRFFYRYVLGWKEPERTWQDLGKRCHAEIEHFILTGENVLGPISSAVKRYIPELAPGVNPNDYLLLEYDIGGGSLENAPLVIAGVPFTGYTDIIRANWEIDGLDIYGTGQAINTEGDGYFDDPPETIECLDWKFGAAKRGTKQDYSKTAAELADDTQMVTQGLYGMKRTPRSSGPVRLSHVYTNTKGRPESSKESILIPRERLVRRAEYIAGVVRTLKDVARETNAEKVPGNPNACESFGGCAYRDQCSTYKQHDFNTYFGNTEGTLNMGVIDNLNIPGFTPNAPAASPATVTAGPAGVAANLGLAGDIAAQLAAFGAVPQTQQPAAPAWAPPQPTKEFVDAVMFINAKGYGMPPLGGDAALMFGVLNRHPNVAPGYTVPGSGDMAQTATVTDPNRIVGIAREIAPLPAKPAAQQATPVAQQTAPAPSSPAAGGLLSAESPASNPALAAQPVEGFASPNAMTPNVQVPGLIASVPPSTAAPILAGADVPAGTPATTTPSGTVEEKKQKERKPRTTKAKADGSNAAPATSDDARWLFINALPQGVAFTDLAPHVHQWAAGMAKHYRCDPPDIRMAAKDTPLAYDGKWGALYACAKKAAATLAPGVYYLNTYDSPLNAAAADGFAYARVQNADGTDGDPVFELVVRGVPR